MGHSPLTHQRYVSRKERLELVGQIASELAHSLNNSLNSMQLRLSLLREETHDSELTSQVDNLSRIVSDTAAKIGIVQEFIASGVTQVEAVDLRAILETAAGLIQEEYAGAHAETRVMLELPSKVPDVRGAHRDLISLFVMLFHYLIGSDPTARPALTVTVKPLAERVTLNILQRAPAPHAVPCKRAFDPFAAIAESPLAASIIALQGRIKQYGGTISFDERTDGYPALIVELANATAPSK